MDLSYEKPNVFINQKKVVPYNLLEGFVLNAIKISILRPKTLVNK